MVDLLSEITRTDSWLGLLSEITRTDSWFVCYLRSLDLTHGWSAI